MTEETNKLQEAQQAMIQGSWDEALRLARESAEGEQTADALMLQAQVLALKGEGKDTVEAALQKAADAGNKVAQFYLAYTRPNVTDEEIGELAEAAPNWYIASHCAAFRFPEAELAPSPTEQAELFAAVEEHAAKLQAADKEYARQKAEEKARKKAAEEARRKAEEEARRKAAEAEARRKAAEERAQSMTKLRSGIGIIFAFCGYAILLVGLIAAIISAWTAPHGAAFLSYVSGIGYGLLAVVIVLLLFSGGALPANASSWKRLGAGILRFLTCGILTMLLFWHFSFVLDNKNDAGEINFLWEGIMALIVFFPWYYMAYIKFRKKEGWFLYEAADDERRAPMVHFICALVWAGVIIGGGHCQAGHFPDIGGWTQKGMDFLYTETIKEGLLGKHDSYEI